MPSVAMNELTRRCTTMKPLAAPMRAAATTATRAATTGLWPSTCMYAVSATETPRTPANDRSKTPAASGMMMPRASIAVMAWSPAMIFALLVVRKVSGTHSENSRIRAPQT